MDSLLESYRNIYFYMIVKLCCDILFPPPDQDPSEATLKSYSPQINGHLFFLLSLFIFAVPEKKPGAQHMIS